MYKKLIIFIILICIPKVVYGAENKYLVDISSGKIISQNSDFYFTIPVSWENYIEVEKITDPNRRFIERWDFIYLPREEENGKTKFLSIYIYNKNNWAIRSNEEVLFKTTNYVFSASIETDNYYTTFQDKIIYERFLSEISNNDFLVSRFTGQDNKLTSSYRITVNNKMIDEKSTKIKNQLYLPLRAVCDELGFSIKWDEKTKTIVINNKVKLRAGQEGAMIIDNYTYLPTIFYVKQLGLNVDVDNLNNVKIS
ncbi:MAG: stalk domain-containing protein [Lachnospirales bacterium]